MYKSSKSIQGFHMRACEQTKSKRRNHKIPTINVQVR